MLADISNVDAIYIVCGRTDMRKSIDGLCAIIQDQFSMEIDHALYLFCGRRRDAERIKVAKSGIRAVEKSRYCVICTRTVNRHRWMRRES